MALPKRRQSKARSRKRRTHYKSASVSTTTCPQCNSTKMPHRACPNCGYYKGRPVISTSWNALLAWSRRWNSYLVFTLYIHPIAKSTFANLDGCVDSSSSTNRAQQDTHAALDKWPSFYSFWSEDVAGCSRPANWGV